MNNLELWSKFEKTDPKYTKDFTKGGGFKGTAINPMYSARRMTEEFGPCGIGWGAEELEHVILEGQGGVKVWFSRVRVWYQRGEEKTGEIEQWGATEFCGFRKGDIPFTDEEAAKKSFTDAFSKCVSLLGLGADIYLNHPGKSFPDCKWTASGPQDEEKPSRPKIPDPPLKTKFDIAFEKVTENKGDFKKLLSYFTTVQKCVEKEEFTVAQATQLALLLVPTALECCDSIDQAYTVMASLEELGKSESIAQKTVGLMSTACAEKLKQLGV